MDVTQYNIELHLKNSL